MNTASISISYHQGEPPCVRRYLQAAIRALPSPPSGIAVLWVPVCARPPVLTLNYKASLGEVTALVFSAVSSVPSLTQISTS